MENSDADAPAGMRRVEIRIPQAAARAMAAAIDTQTVAARTWPDGIQWMYPLGTWDEPHVEVALMPGGEEIWVRMSDQRAAFAVWTLNQWDEFADALRTLPRPGETRPGT
ncbi:hypothetical protein ACN20G_37205 (plasmid) [Streptomyces sp. BI20]|uniref:hypothetical protein n=1 Tax=Streptomyces sp. BI20 TaxID=3403460 RepID=UPI003C720123